VEPRLKPVIRFFRNAFARFRIAGALLSFMWRRKIWWMVPLVAVLLVLSVLVIFGQSSAISAFVYALF
jgi:hypothetical protein